MSIDISILQNLVKLPELVFINYLIKIKTEINNIAKNNNYAEYAAFIKKCIGITILSINSDHLIKLGVE